MSVIILATTLIDAEGVGSRRKETLLVKGRLRPTSRLVQADVRISYPLRRHGNTDEPTFLRQWFVKASITRRY